jgi:hypothetical protein
MTKARRLRTVCNLLAAFLLIVALRQLVDPVLTAIDPLLGTAELNCSPCAYETDPIRLLDRPLRDEGWAAPDVAAKILERLESPRVRGLLLLSSIAAALPLSLAFVFLALALRSFVGSGFRSGAARWLRWTAGAAVLWAAMGPVSRGLGALALDAVFTGADQIRLPVDFYHLARGLMMAGAALAAVWVLQEGAEQQDDLEQYV